MDKKEKKSLPEPRTYTVEQIAAMLLSFTVRHNETISFSA